MKTKIGMSFGLAFMLAVGVFATMLALGMFAASPVEASEISQPADQMVPAGLVDPGDGLTVGEQNNTSSDLNMLTSATEINLYQEVPASAPIFVVGGSQAFDDDISRFGSNNGTATVYLTHDTTFTGEIRNGPAVATLTNASGSNPGTAEAVLTITVRALPLDSFDGNNITRNSGTFSIADDNTFDGRAVATMGLSQDSWPDWSARAMGDNFTPTNSSSLPTQTTNAAFDSIARFTTGSLTLSGARPGSPLGLEFGALI